MFHTGRSCGPVRCWLDGNKPIPGSDWLFPAGRGHNGVLLLRRGCGFTGNSLRQERRFLTGKKANKAGGVGVKEGSFYSGADPLKTGRLNCSSHPVEKGSYLPDFPSLYPA